MRNACRVALLVLGLIVVLTGVVFAAPKAKKSAYGAGGGLRLVIATTKKTSPRGKPIRIKLYIENMSKKTVRFDGRLSFPGNGRIYVKPPSGKLVPESSICASMALLQADDVISLRPGQRHSMRLSVGGRRDSDCPPELQTMRAGVYLIWVNYWGSELASARCPAVSLNSNWLRVVVK